MWIKWTSLPNSRGFNIKVNNKPSTTTANLPWLIRWDPCFFFAQILSDPAAFLWLGSKIPTELRAGVAIPASAGILWSLAWFEHGEDLQLGLPLSEATAACARPSPAAHLVLCVLSAVECAHALAWPRAADGEKHEARRPPQHRARKGQEQGRAGSQQQAARVRQRDSPW